MWHDIKEKLPKVGDLVEIETKNFLSVYAKFEESDMDLYFRLQCTKATIGLDEITRWRYDPTAGWFQEYLIKYKK